MISTNLGRKLIFSLLVIIVLTIGITFIYRGTTSLIDYWKNRAIREREQKIEKYENEINAINNVNFKLIEDIKRLDNEVDSLIRLKSKIYWKYEENVNVIYDATASEHAVWMDTTIQKLNNIKNQRK